MFSLCRLPPPVRLLLAPNRCRFSSQLAPRRAFDPLRILFCGSDDFSIHSLRALHAAQQEDSSLIDSIEVVHRSGKHYGRGLNRVKEVPLKKFARELHLPRHELDSFGHWQPEKKFDLIIAVSFGVFIPGLVIDRATYGGLNLHPSLLPDLRGPAPLHHALLKRRPTTGISIQTLDRVGFDRGPVILQTPPPGIPVPDGSTVPSLIALLGPLAGELLVYALKEGLFLPPVQDAGWYAASGGIAEYAPKVGKADSHIDFEVHTSDDIMLKHRVLGDLWCLLPYKSERVILNKISMLAEDVEIDREPGFHNPHEYMKLYARTIDGALLNIEESTVSGGKKKRGNAHIKRQLNNAAVRALIEAQKDEMEKERMDKLLAMNESERRKFILAETRQRKAEKIKKAEEREARKKQNWPPTGESF